MCRNTWLLRLHLARCLRFRFLICWFLIADFRDFMIAKVWSYDIWPTAGGCGPAWSQWLNHNPTDHWRLCLRYPMLSVLICKAVTREIWPLPGVLDGDRADSSRQRRWFLGGWLLPGILTTIALIHGDEKQEFPTMTELSRGMEELRYAFDFYMQSNNMGDLTLTRGFLWESWFMMTEMHFRF